MKIYEKHPKYFFWSFGSDKTAKESLIDHKFRYRILNNDCLEYGLFCNAYSEYWGNSEKIFIWCDENLIEQWTYVYDEQFRHCYFYFQNKEDAVKFMLRFGANHLEILK